jgi:PKHD-type hydroxylase
MLVHVPAMLGAEEASRFCARLAAAPWGDGRATAGSQSGAVKRNQQLPEDGDVARELGARVLAALDRAPLFRSAALPARVFPPLFNRYAEGMDFGAHIDNAIRRVPGSHLNIRTDLSATLFLAPPESYDGGELVIEDTYGVQTVKLAAGDMILYPATSRHRVMPVTRGERLACFFWVQSLVKDDAERAMLFELDRAIQILGAGDANHPEILRLTGLYHNLVRKWGAP